MSMQTSIYDPTSWEQLNQQDPDNYPLTVDDYKITRPLAISQAFSAEFTNRVFASSLGFNVDNRRSGTKFDKDNVQSLIDIGQEPVTFKDADGNYHQLSLTELSTIKTEMIQDGLGLYQKKWNLGQQIEVSTTIDELKAITW